MKILAKRQIIIWVLVGFLVCRLVGAGFLPFADNSTLENALSSALFKEMSLLIWQDNDVDGVATQITARLQLNRADADSNNYNPGVLYCDNDNTDFDYHIILLRITDSPNTIFKFQNGQACQNLDIPPPDTSAFL